MLQEFYTIVVIRTKREKHKSKIFRADGIEEVSIDSLEPGLAKKLEEAKSDSIRRMEKYPDIRSIRTKEAYIISE